MSVAIFTAGLLLWTQPRMPMYVLVVPLIWLLAQAPAEALAMGVVDDVARVPVGVIVTAMLAWREYRSTRERLFAGAILLVGILLVANDTLLMVLGSVFLIVTSVVWYLRRPGGRGLAKPSASPGQA